jgi:hypothetical protein
MTTDTAMLMKGGFQAQIGDLFSKYEQPVGILTTLCLLTVIIFVGKIPVEVRKQADSFTGRLFLLGFTILVTVLYGWPLGFLAGVMSALVIGAGGIHPTVPNLPTKTNLVEGFSPDFNVRLVPTKKKWFVEKVLGENPMLIEDTVVDTSAVQDLSERTAGSVQSNTVTR